MLASAMIRQPRGRSKVLLTFETKCPMIATRGDLPGSRCARPAHTAATCIRGRIGWGTRTAGALPATSDARAGGMPGAGSPCAGRSWSSTSRAMEDRTAREGDSRRSGVGPAYRSTRLDYSVPTPRSGAPCRVYAVSTASRGGPCVIIAAGRAVDQGVGRLQLVKIDGLEPGGHVLMREWTLDQHRIHLASPACEWITSMHRRVGPPATPDLPRPRTDRPPSPFAATRGRSPVPRSSRTRLEGTHTLPARQPVPDLLVGFLEPQRAPPTTPCKPSAKVPGAFARPLGASFEQGIAWPEETGPRSSCRRALAPARA
jgi:hypothetical protein